MEKFLHVKTEGVRLCSLSECLQKRAHFYNRTAVSLEELNNQSSICHKCSTHSGCKEAKLTSNAIDLIYAHYILHSLNSGYMQQKTRGPNRTCNL